MTAQRLLSRVLSTVKPGHFRKGMRVIEAIATRRSLLNRAYLLAQERQNAAMMEALVFTTVGFLGTYCARRNVSVVSMIAYLRTGEQKEPNGWSHALLDGMSTVGLLGVETTEPIRKRTYRTYGRPGTSPRNDLPAYLRCGECLTFTEVPEGLETVRCSACSRVLAGFPLRQYSKNPDGTLSALGREQQRRRVENFRNQQKIYLLIIVIVGLLLLWHWQASQPVLIDGFSRGVVGVVVH